MPPRPNRPGLALQLAPGTTAEWTLASTVVIIWRDLTVRLSPGATTDFASVPWWGRWLIPQVGRNARAAIVHDALYRVPSNRHAVQARSADTVTLHRKAADDLLFDMARRDGMGRIRARLMYAAVRLGGASAWKPDPEAP